MKTTFYRIAVALLVLSSVAQAEAVRTPEATIRAALPETLVCQVEQRGQWLPAQFTLSSLGQGTVEADLADQGPFNQAFSWLVVAFEFSNQCDNRYTVLFPGGELFDFGRGIRDEVVGSLHYSNSRPESERSLIRCSR